MQKSEYKSREEVPTTGKLWTQHQAGEISFAYTPTGPNYYLAVGKQILDSNKKVPTGDYTASLLHAAYFGEARDGRGFGRVREIMKNNWLWVFNQNLWTPKGVYVVQDVNAVGRTMPLDISHLEGILNGGEELSWGGIRFSKNKGIRFAPKGSYQHGEMTPEQFAKDGFILASLGVEGAEKLGEISSTFNRNPFSYTLNLDKGQELRISSVGGGVCNLWFSGSSLDDDDTSHAFGVG